MKGGRVILIYQQFIDALVPWKNSVFSDLTETTKASCVTGAPDPSIQTMATLNVMSAAGDSLFPATSLTNSYNWWKRRAVLK